MHIIVLLLLRTVQQNSHDQTTASCFGVLKFLRFEVFMRRDLLSSLFMCMHLLFYAKVKTNSREIYDTHGKAAFGC